MQDINKVIRLTSTFDEDIDLLPLKRLENNVLVHTMHELLAKIRSLSIHHSSSMLSALKQAVEHNQKELSILSHAADTIKKTSKSAASDHHPSPGRHPARSAAAHRGLTLPDGSSRWAQGTSAKESAEASPPA
jgi:hypothetical protein